MTIVVILGAALCLVALGFSIGIKTQETKDFKIFCDMADDGRLVFKADGHWEGEPAAFEEIGRQLVLK